MWGSTDPEASRKAILKMVPLSRTSMPDGRKQRTEPRTDLPTTALTRRRRSARSPIGKITTDCSCRCSPAGGTVSARPRMVPTEVPTYRQGVRTPSPFLAKVSVKWNAVTASRASLSMLVTLEERERLKELSRWSSGVAPRGGHTDRRTVGRRQREVKHLQTFTSSRKMMDSALGNRERRVK